MDEDTISKQLSTIQLQDDSSVMTDIDTSTTPSATSTITYKEYSPSPKSIRDSAAVVSAGRSNTDHHYQLVGNISIINQMYVIFI